MTTGLGDLHARCVPRDSLLQPLHGDGDDRGPGAVDGPGNGALVRRRQALRVSELAGGMLSRSGARA